MIPALSRILDPEHLLESECPQKELLMPESSRGEEEGGLLLFICVCGVVR